MKRKAIWAYCRVSTTKMEQELSLEQQIEWARTVARQRGAELVVYSERASAKTITARPQCVRMINELERCKPHERPLAVVATSFDRLSRDITDTMVLARALRQAGVELYVRDRGVVPMTSFADQAALVGQAMGGHAENDARSNRAKASWERRRREGKPTSNKSPYGLQLRGERDMPAEDSSDWVLKAFTWYAQGLGMHTIAERFKAGAPPHRVVSTRVGPDGAPIVRERRHVWESNRIHKLLVQQRYRGTIVPDALFEAVAERLKHTPRTSQIRRSEYPLSGAVKCAGCGRSFHGHATGGGTRKKRRADGSISTYNYNRIRAYACNVCNVHINANFLETTFRKDLEHLRAHPKLLREWIASPGHSTSEAQISNEMRIITRNLDRVSARRQRAWDLALDPDLSVSHELPAQLARLNQEEAVLRDRLSELNAGRERAQMRKRTVDHARDLLRNFWTLFDAAEYEQQRELARAVVDALGGAVASKQGIAWLHGAPWNRKKDS